MTFNLRTYPFGALSSKEGCGQPLGIARLAFGAAARGELEDLQWMISQGYGKGHWHRSAALVGAAAAAGGHLRVLEWLVSEGYEMDESTSSSAAWAGQLEVLQWLRQKECPWSAEVLCVCVFACEGPEVHSTH